MRFFPETSDSCIHFIPSAFKHDPARKRHSANCNGRANQLIERSIVGLFLAAMLVTALIVPAAWGQTTDALAQQLANDRVSQEELNFFLRVQRVTPQEYQARGLQLAKDIQAVRVEISKRPRDQQPLILQQSESLFQTRIVPLRQEWQRELAEKQQSDAARNDQIRKEMLVDAAQAGKFQAARALLLEKLKTNQISKDEFDKNDKIAEQEVLTFQHKYDAYGANWGAAFSQTVAAESQRTLADAKVQSRLDDTTTPIGQDTHRAAELNLSMQRNSFLRARQAITPQMEQQQNAALQAQLGPLLQKYAASEQAADFRDRYYRLVQAGTTERQGQWEADAQQARQALAQNRAPAASNTQSVPAPPKAPAQSSAPRRMPNAPPRPPIYGGYQFPQRPAPSNTVPVSTWIGLLLLVAAGGGGYYFYTRRSARPPAPSYVDLKSQFQIPPALAIASATPASSAPTSRQQLPVQVPSLTSDGKQLPLKERLCAEQRLKYQARYNDVLDGLTAASATLATVAGVPASVQNNLKLLAKATPDRVENLIRARTAKTGKIALNAAVFMPLYRTFRRHGLILKAIILVAVLYYASQAVNLFLSGQFLALIFMYLILFGISYLFERHYQRKARGDAPSKSADVLKSFALAHIYKGQQPHAAGGAPSFYAVKVSTEANKPLPEDIELPAGSDTSNGPGKFLLIVGNIATYWVDALGTITLAFSSPQNSFMTPYGSLLTQALSEQKPFFASTLPPFADYGQLAWAKRQAAEDVPQLEKLLHDVDRLENLWRGTAISDKVYDFLLRRIDLFNMRDSATPSGILLYGYTGNGKLHLANKIAESVSARLEKVNPATLNSAAEVKKLWDAALASGPVVLLVESAEQVFPRPGSENQGSGTREATLAWLTEWGKLEPAQSRVWVVLTAESDQELHPAILNKIGGSKIEISAPDAANRELILRNACRTNGLPDSIPGWLVAGTGGASVRELLEIVKETKLQCVPNPPEDSHWKEAVKTVRGSNAEFKDEKKTWDRLVLPAEIKNQLQAACRILQEADRYKERGISVPNVLLFGPPGTGKTDIARTFANEGGVKFLMATTADLKAQYVGQSAHLVRNIFAKARSNAPAVLFIDEIETVAAKRGSQMADQFTQDVVTEMLAQMDGAKKYDRPVFVLAATNLPEMIDPAILSRFTSKIEIPLPDEASRCEMLKRLIRERAMDPALNVDEVSAVLAKRLARKSGRDLVMLVNRAMERAVMAADSPENVRLTQELLMAEVAPQGREVSEADLQKIWAQIVLKPEIKESILSKIRMFNKGDKAAPRGLLLYGPPGTGKTEIARRIADSTSSHFMSLTASDLKAGYVGQSGQSVKKVWEQARSHGKCVIFIDECDAVFGRRGSVNTDSGTEELVPEFLASWDGVASEGQIWVVGATNQRQRLDEAIVSRFGAAVEIGLPEAPERLQILRMELKKFERESEIPDFVGRATTGFAGRDLSQVARDLCSLAAEHNGAITEDLWRQVIARYAKASSETVDEGARWESLVLSEDTIDKLKTVCESLKQIEVLQKQGIQPPRGALLYGPPGTGKTQIARTLANESGLPFIAAGPSDIKGGYIGQSGLKVHELFERARSKAPCILFIDEIDSGAAARGSAKSDQFTDDIVTQMLTELDGVKKNERHVFLLAATNHPENVDSAILSRFVEKIEIPNPDLDQRRKLLQVLLAKKRVDFDVNRVAGELAGMTGEISGRDVYSLVERASQQALRRALKAGRADQIILSREDLLHELPAAQNAANSAARGIAL